MTKQKEQVYPGWLVKEISLNELDSTLFLQIVKDKDSSEELDSKTVSSKMYMYRIVRKVLVEGGTNVLTGKKTYRDDVLASSKIKRNYYLTLMLGFEHYYMHKETLELPY